MNNNNDRLSRRDVLRAGAGAAAFAAAPLSLSAAAGYAAPATRHLVIVRLDGGNDALNTMFPVGADPYFRARPALAIRSGAVELDDEYGLHPRLAPLRRFWDAGRLALVPGIGYPTPDRSHFRSMDIWESAKPGVNDTTTGWLGRALDRKKGSGPSALALGTGILPLSLRGRDSNPWCVEDADSFVGDVGLDERSESLLERVAAGQDDAASRAMTGFLEARRRLKAAPESTEVTRRGLAKDLNGVARCMRAELGAQVFHVSMRGYDTHARQADIHGSLLGELATSLDGFFADLQRDGLDRRTVVFVFSEFGRRVKENGTAGTDHGAGGLAFLLGSGVSGGVRSPYPSLTDLDNGDMKHTVDFRHVYAALLREVLRVDPKKVLGSAFPPAPVLSRSL